MGDRIMFKVIVFAGLTSLEMMFLRVARNGYIVTDVGD